MERRRNLTPFRASTGRPQPPCGFFIFVLIFFYMLQHFGTLMVRAQSQEGFISIDCGLANGSDYRDENNGLQYTGDSQFINTGDNKNVSDNPFSQQYRTLRSFPNGRRNCYRLSPVQSGNKYLIRAGFFYGNYDSQDTSPVFDLHIGVNFWTTVKMGSDGRFVSDIITMSQGELIRVCLVNTGIGTPFISVLELRPLLNFMYPFANAFQSLANQTRLNYGNGSQLRFPDDPYDRIWEGVVGGYLILNSTSEVEAKAGDTFQVPSRVLKSALSYTDTTGQINTPTVSGSPGERIYVVMHFAELEALNSANESRQLNIFGVDGQQLLFENYSPPYLSVDHKEITDAVLDSSGSYTISIKISSSSTEPFLINALESFIVRPMNEAETDDRDVSAMEDIKDALKVTENWEADPCSPRAYTWKGVTCTGDGEPGPARIVSLNLSSSGLVGEIPTSIGNLTALTKLDLSNNNLMGPIPDILGGLESLRLINLSGNEAIGVIPQNICQKILKGALSLSINGGPTQCESSNTNTKKIILPVIIAASILITILVAVFFWLIRRKRKTNSSEGFSNKPDNNGNTTREDNAWKREIVKFKYGEIRQITQNFRHEIGKGGFGMVYLGNLKDGTNVAVKVLSSSLQGSKEFEAEVQLLARVHHRNLVCLLGYCDDVKHLSLVYEYMDNGTLQDHLSGKIKNANLLTWNQRVNIALQAAQGLDYLHNGCIPPIVHRDIKSNNILLNCKLLAKIGDFGLSRTFSNDSATHITTRLAGTPGYLDPEYYQNHKLNEKSDVYSFGIFLLEIITGQPPYQKSLENIHIVKWVHSKVEIGDIMNIIDPRLQGDFDINMAWKIIEIAMSCTSIASEERMTMSNVILHLKHCMDANESHTIFEHNESSIKSLNDTFDFRSSTPTAPLVR